MTAPATHQLTPDLAEPLSQADLAIFVDARSAREGDSVRRPPLEPLDDPSAFAGHTSDPQGLLALAQTVYGHRPPAWLVSVPAIDFSLREGLSPTAARGVAEALPKIAALIKTRGDR